ncbi:MAG: hypothetical protein Roseis2KO_56760 [Roseivirga sp.]
MGKPGRKYVAKGEQGIRLFFIELSPPSITLLVPDAPTALLEELNGTKRREVIAALNLKFKRDKR